MSEQLSGRRMTPKEYDAYKAQHAAPEEASSSVPPVTDPAVAIGKSLNPESLKEMASGFAYPLRKTALGVKQAGTYLFGDDAARERVNEEAKQLEAEAPETIEGKLGDFAGSSALFAVPGSIAGKVAGKVPAATKFIQKIVGAPGTVKRGMAVTGAYEALQPVTPSNAGNEEFLLNKAGNVAKGMALAVPTAALGTASTQPYLLTKTGRKGMDLKGVAPQLEIAPERKAIVEEAKRLGLPLTPAQRTADRTLQQYEEGLLAKPGSSKLIQEVRDKQQQVLNKKAAEALGAKDAEAPSAAVMALVREKAAKGYEPIAGIKQMGTDEPYIQQLHNFISGQHTKAAGSPDAAAVAERVIKGSNSATGSDFLEDLQAVRDLAYGARKKGDKATADRLRDLNNIMEDFLERRVMLAAEGELPPGALEAFKKSRRDYATLHSIEKATNPDTGQVSAKKFGTQELKRKPASAGKRSPLDKDLADVSDTARVMRQTQPYIGSSGTAERMGGQQMVDASTSPTSLVRHGIPLAKNYMAAKMYLNYGDQPGFLGKHLSPTQNMMVRRLLPEEALAAEEAAAR